MFPNIGPRMRNVAAVLEEFFSSRFVNDGQPDVREMRISTANMKYCILFAEDSNLILNADPVNPSPGFPAFEIGFKCRLCVIEELSGGIPALFFYSSFQANRQGLKLVVTKIIDQGIYSISPVFAPDES